MLTGTEPPDRDVLGRGPLTRRLPVLWQAAPEPPDAEPFTVPAGATPTRFLLHVIGSMKRLSVPAAVCAGLQMIAQSLIPVVMGVAIDRALATGDASQLVVWLVVLAGVVAVQSTASRFAQQLTFLATQHVQHRLRATVSRAVLHPTRPVGRHLDGTVVSVMTNDVMRLAMVGLGVYPVAELVTIVVIAVALLLVSWPVGLAALLGAPVVVWLMGRLSARFARDSRVYQTSLAGTVGRATDLVAGYRVIKGVRAEAEATRRYRDASRATLDAAYRNLALLGRSTGGNSTLSSTFVAVVAGLAALFAVNGQLTVGGLIAAVGLAQALLPQMHMVAMNAVPSWSAAVAASARVLEALGEAGTPDIPDTPGAPAAAPAGTAGHAGPVVEVTVTGLGVVRVEPGELVGVRADDRTAAALVDALLDPRSPVDDDLAVDVAVDGVPADRVEGGHYRSRVVVAPHHGALFTGTVAQNLDLAGALDELRGPALRAASCDDFVAAGTGGHDSEVGEMGNRLSGGQRQRVALARALARDAGVLVLHDPTTAVDSVTEARIADGLRGLRRGRSTIVVASSPALLGACDRVVDLRAAPTPAPGPAGSPAGSPVEVGR